ncbi:MAG: DsbA family protein [Halofilum sp. (in: g-proteobacteria)]
MSRVSRLFVLMVFALAVSTAAFGDQAYRTLDSRGAGDPDTVEVTEFFWYGCPHCHRFAPYIERWSADIPEDVEFRHMPAVFAPSWEIHGRAFYAAKAMDVLEQFHPAMFEALHEQGRQLDSEEAIGEFVEELGLDGDKFVATMQSFAVDANMRRARDLQETYGIEGTPSVVIDGRFVTSGGMAGGFDRMIEVIDERVAAARGGSN